MMRNPGLSSGGFHDKVVSILSFLFCKEENNFFRFLLGRTGRWFSASHTLCFACTGGNALLQASVYFIPNRSHCCTEGIFHFVQSNHTQRNANVQIRVEWYEHQASRYCSAVDLGNMGTNISASVFGQLERFPLQL